jgi:hypothetical protein
MKESNSSLLGAVLYEKTDKNGETYIIGDLGLLTIMLFKKKNESGKWILKLSQRHMKPKEENQNKANNNFGPNFNNEEDDNFNF